MKQIKIYKIYYKNNYNKIEIVFGIKKILLITQIIKIIEYRINYRIT